LTPVHILSRKGQFLEPFLQKGYTTGMIPDGSLPHLGMDGFLADFLVAFSR
jgi:hypothetical protein